MERNGGAGRQGAGGGLAGALPSFYSVMVQPQSYLNLLYLLVAFPLGIFYFVFLVTGLSVGLATAIIWVGFLVLLFMGGAWFLLAGFERWMAAVVLRQGATPKSAPDPVADPIDRPSGAWARLKRHLRNTTTWTSLF